MYKCFNIMQAFRSFDANYWCPYKNIKVKTSLFQFRIFFKIRKDTEQGVVNKSITGTER